MIFDYKRRAKSISMGKSRLLSSVRGVVIHYTGNAGDTARNNADFFATSNTRAAGAHIFIDGKGLSALSIPLRRVAWSVGNPGGCYAPGGYYNILNNSNTVSIELCDLIDHPVTDVQMEKLKDMIAYIRRKCPYCTDIVRHYDIVKKDCPAYYVENRPEWLKLRAELLPILRG